MQVVKFGERIEHTYSEVSDDEELIVDPNEIEAIIRRAITISWLNTIYTHQELEDILLANSVQLPYDPKRRAEYFDEVIARIWHKQQELARAAMQPIPTLFRGIVEGTPHLGIVIPEVTIGSSGTDRVSETTTELMLIEEAQKLEAATIVDSKLIADKILTYMTNDHGRLPIDRQKLPELIVSDTGIRVDGAALRHSLRILLDNRLVSIYTTGSKKSSRQWVKLGEDVDTDIKEMRDEGTYHPMLDYIFEGLSESA